VFDHRKERITDDVVSQCHHAAPLDVHTNCVNEGCHLLLFSVMAKKNVRCCSTECYHYSLVRRRAKAIRKGIKMEIRFSKKENQKLFSK
jgi:UPF0176 protein